MTRRVIPDLLVSGLLTLGVSVAVVALALGAVDRSQNAPSWTRGTTAGSMTTAPDVTREV